MEGWRWGPDLPVTPSYHPDLLVRFFPESTLAPRRSVPELSAMDEKTPETTSAYEPLGRQNLGWIWGPILVIFVWMVSLFLSGSNLSLFKTLNLLAVDKSDLYWTHLTLLGDAVFALLFFAPFLRRDPQLLWTMFLTALLATIATEGLKVLVQIPRPPISLGVDRIHLVGALPLSSSFPSGHSVTAFAVAAIFILHFPKAGWRRWLLLILAGMIAHSRIAIGVHWPADVLFGAWLGWGSALVAFRIRKAFPGPQQASRGHLLLAAAFLLPGIVLLSFYHTTYEPYTRWFQLIFEIGFLVWGIWEWNRLRGEVGARTPAG